MIVAAMGRIDLERLSKRADRAGAATAAARQVYLPLLRGRGAQGRADPRCGGGPRHDGRPPAGNVAIGPLRRATESCRPAAGLPSRLLKNASVSRFVPLQRANRT